METRKGQIAMEYLATYGWALFAMFAVVAVLVASGLLGAGRYQSEECTFAPNLPCTGTYLAHELSDPTGTKVIAHINLTNAQGFPMYITDCNYTLIGGDNVAQIGGDPACDLQQITRQGDSLQYEVTLTAHTRVQTGETRTVYVNFGFRNCQDAQGIDDAATAADCLARFPEHQTSGKIVASVRG